MSPSVVQQVFAGRPDTERRDAQRFLFSLPVGGGTTPPYQVILNWQAALTPAD